MNPAFENKIDIDYTHLENLLETLIAIPSVSGSEKAISDYIVDELKEYGLNPKQDKMYNVIVRIEGNKQGKSFLLNGHIDTVPPGDEWDNDPFRPRRDKNRIYGLGAADMKAGISVMMELARVFQARIKELNGTIIFAFTVGEEIEDHNKHGALHIAKEVKADMGLVLEPSQQEDERNLSIKLGSCGRAVFEIKIYGKSAHSSRPFLGINVIEIGSKIVSKVREKADQLEYYEIPEIGVRFKPGFVVTQFEHNENPSNVIPHLCKLTIDRRTVPFENHETVKKQIENLLEEVQDETTEKYRYEIIEKGRMDPCQMPFDLPLLKSLQKNIKEIDGYEPKIIFALGATDIGFFTNHGADMLVFGPGDTHIIHQPEEYVHVKALHALADVCLETIFEMVGRKE